MQDIHFLLERCKKGDQRSQREVYALFGRKWMGICARYCKDSDDAKDVFQEATVKIFMEMHNLKTVGAFAGWARRIVINTALNFLKNRKAYWFTLQNYHFGSEQWENSEEETILRMDNEKLVNIIHELPEGYRIVFNLFMVDGYRHAEIGKLLNISESTSRSQLNKAKQYLKRILTTQGITYNAKIIG